MKFKVGDKVRFKDGNQCGIGVIVGVDNDKTPYLVYSKDIKNGHAGVLSKCRQNNKKNWWFRESELELIDTDLRDLLQVGYMYSINNQEFSVAHDRHLEIMKGAYDCNLRGNYSDINAIYRPTYNGVLSIGNPQWVTVWERKEPSYTLQCPLTKKYLWLKDEQTFDWLNLEFCFTQSEIDELPHQGLVKALIQKEVE